jgi:hypothetical protein
LQLKQKRSLPKGAEAKLNFRKAVWTQNTLLQRDAVGGPGQKLRESVGNDDVEAAAVTNEEVEEVESLPQVSQFLMNENKYHRVVPHLFTPSI